MHYDLIIVGGGLVGAGLALALRSSSLRLALIDARDPSKEDPRLFALNASSCDFLENIKMWEALKKHASPIHEVHVSYQGRFGSLSLKREDVSLSTLGHVIPAKFIEAAFQEKLPLQSNITLYHRAYLKALKQVDGLGHLTIKTENGEIELTASLVIGADGSQSTVRKALDIPTEIFDYKQSAVVTQTTLECDHQCIAYERFVKQGAIAMLPMSGKTCATIWTADQDKAHSLMQLSDEAFKALLLKEFGYRLGRLISIGKRHVFPLQKILAKQSTHQNVLLLGNALHTMHPIAAQGLNLALYEVAKFTDAIIESKSSFSSLDLFKISEEMKKKQAVSLGLSHHLSQFFSKKSSWLASLLSLGMIGLDILSPLKKRLLKHML